MKKLLLALLLLAGSVSAQVTIDGHTYADTIHITSGMLPYTASTNDRAYVLQADIGGLSTAPSGQIYFNNCDTCALISEPGNKYTLTFTDTTNGAGGEIGVRVAGSEFFKMRDVRLVAGWAQTDTFYYPFPTLLSLSSSYNSKIDSSYFYMTGFSLSVAGWGHSCIYMSQPYMVDIVDDSIIMEGYGFDNRQYYPQMAIFSQPSETNDITTGSRSDYGLRVARNYIQSSWIGIYYGKSGSSDGVLVADSNNIILRWAQESTTPGAGGSMVGDGGAFTSANINKAFIRGNTITSVIDTTATPKIRGGNGAFFGTIINDSLPSTPRSEIAYNTFAVAGYYPTDHVNCIFNKWGGLADFDIHNNSFTTTIYDTDSNYTYGECVWVWNIQGSNFYDNTYRMVNYHSGTEGIALRLRNEDITQQPTFNRETIYSNDWFMDLLADDASMEGIDLNDFSWNRIDTVTTLSGSGVLSSVMSWAPGETVSDISFYDLRTDGIAVDTAITWNGTSLSGTWLDWNRSFAINTRTSLGVPVNATVNVVNSYGDTVYNSAVGTDGLDTLTAKYWFSTAGTSDSSFNPFIFTAIYAGDSVMDTTGIGATDSTITLTIGESELIINNTKRFKGSYLKGVK